MKTFLLRYVGFLGGMILILVISSCNKPDDVIPGPVISITSPNPDLWNESITGYVQGIDPKNFKIVVYGKINLGWHNLPNRETPVLAIAEDTSWSCPLTINQISAISEYKIFMLPNGYSPPILVDEKVIPVKLNLVSAAKTRILVDRLSQMQPPLRLPWWAGN